jgi:hypothetical protein
MIKAAPALMRYSENFDPQREFSVSGWLAVASRRGAGRYLAAIGTLLVLLASLAGVCLQPARRPAPLHFQSEAKSDFAARYLPGAPDADPGEFEQVAAPLLGEVAAVRNANVPMVPLGPSAKPFRFAGSLPDRMRARACLAAAMLFEAGDDGAGQLAVGQVVLNRVRHPAFPKSVCGVVLQGSERATGCQFTFTCDGSLARHTSRDRRTRALMRADMMLTGLTYGAVGLATHYHTVDVYPWWSPKLEKIARQGAHLFFRWPGYWGTATVAANHQEVSEPSAALFASFDPFLGPSDLTEAIGAEPAGVQETPVQRAAVTSAALTARDHDGVTDAAKLGMPASRRLPGATKDEGRAATVVIAPAALEGNRILRMFPREGVFFLEVGPGSSDSARRRVAGHLCGGRAECRVYGWQDASSASATIELDRAATAKLAFQFVRKPAADARAVPFSANAL